MPRGRKRQIEPAPEPRGEAEGPVVTLTAKLPPVVAELPGEMQTSLVAALQQLVDAAVLDLMPTEQGEEEEELAYEHLCIFKVWLSRSKRIVRRLAVPDILSLDDLHELIFHAFDRYDPHLYSFYFYEPGVKGRDRRRSENTEYSDPIRFEQFGDTEDLFGKPIHNAAETPLSALGLQVGQVFEYIFDFGDYWEHEIEVEEVDRKPDGGPYPRILEKKGESPAQYEYEDEEDDAEEE